LTGAGEGLIDFGRSLVLLIVLDQLDVDWLVGADTHEMERSSSVADHAEVGSILGVVEAAERAVFYAETILPEV
jgi:hypothetical protein